MCVLLPFSGKNLHCSFSFFLVTQVQKKHGKEKHHGQFPQEGRREMPRNIICIEYKDCWMPRKKVYFQETKVNASSYVTSDGSFFSDQLPDGGYRFFLLLLYNYEKGQHKALTKALQSR